jgi:hypothetical protein
MRFRFPIHFAPLIAGLVLLNMAPVAQAQRPYVGYVYPAGGQQGTTFQVRLGGQSLNDLDGVLISGKGISARIVDYMPRLQNMELTLLQEQLKELRTGQPTPAVSGAPPMEVETSGMMIMSTEESDAKRAELNHKRETKALIERIESRVNNFVQIPACISISNVVVVEVRIASDADPGDHEIRLSALKGVTNPLIFQVGTIREYSAEPMRTSPQHVLGKEAQALRKRGAKDGDREVQLPCTVNGQIGPGEINRFHFQAKKGQQFVFSAQCRCLIPYIADAVPGWFQGVIALYDSKGREVAFGGSKPDPVILFKVPEDGSYTLAIHDSLYRGREDFVYRIQMGTQPYITSHFPLGGQVGVPVMVSFEGVNFPDTVRQQTVSFDSPGIHKLTIRGAGFVSNEVPFVVDTLPSVMKIEGHNSEQNAQVVTNSVIINGRIENSEDVDMFRVDGKAGETLVVEVMARRLGSPLDSFVTVTDGQGKLIALNDDCMDVGDGVNTDHADSYLSVRLPASGVYFIHISDRARKGGPEYAYRLRISPPQPDFELRLVPSSLALRYNSSAPITVYALRKDDYDGPIQVKLNDPPSGISAQPLVIPKGQTVGKLTIKTAPYPMRENFILKVVGSAKVGSREIVRTAVAAEDKMQAFLWRQLVPTKAFVATVFDPNFTPPPERPAPVPPPKQEPISETAATAAIPIASATVATKAQSTSSGEPDVSQTNMMMAEAMMARGLAPQTNATSVPTSTQSASVPGAASLSTTTAATMTMTVSASSPNGALTASVDPQPPVTAVNVPATTPASSRAAVPPGTAPTVSAATPASQSPTAAVPAVPRFTKQQVAGRLKQLKILYEEGLLTDSFYLKKIQECEAVQ